MGASATPACSGPLTSPSPGSPVVGLSVAAPLLLLFAPVVGTVVAAPLLLSALDPTSVVSAETVGPLQPGSIRSRSSRRAVAGNISGL